MAITGLTSGAKATQGTSQTNTSSNVGKGYSSLGTEDFVKILLAELQNQNPLEPTDTGKLVEQFSSINNLTVTQQLNTTLSQLGLSQNLSSASGLIGKSVTGKIGNKDVSGVVDRAEVDKGQVSLVIGDTKLPIGSVTGVNPAPVTKNQVANDGNSSTSNQSDATS